MCAVVSSHCALCSVICLCTLDLYSESGLCALVSVPCALCSGLCALGSGSRLSLSTLGLGYEICLCSLVPGSVLCTLCFPLCTLDSDAGLLLCFLYSVLCAHCPVLFDLGSGLWFCDL